MKLKKILLSFLVAQSALFPFVVSVNTEAGISEFCSEQLETVKNGFYSIPSYLGSAALAGEKLGVKGLEKLSFSINPASIYKFFRNHHEMTAILALIGVCSAWYSSKKISAWDARQSKLKQEVLKSIANNFAQFTQICDDMKNNKRRTDYVTLPTNATTLANAQNIVTLPFLRKDQKLITPLAEFYTQCRNVITEANQNITMKPDTSSESYKAAFSMGSKIELHILSLL